ncbi:winged helix-turn-helix domain-containing protein [Halomonas dongshanensis]|uniref:Winged helix-turn-helix domain-containing protein n=1 Tax=Halomonas dongshanensis TaxID=2890835 RepID=A0ABT2EGH8_9GAMM|nr:winged helix-turn-helix domain-containing protein [Halomonas dongshanensis]MCS2610692.1 winged helix-turn-helix domain-containing protein [Halomonas dongshanensis]
MTRTHHPAPTFQLRLALARDVVIGPGKAALLDAVERTGSISAAGRTLNMSYKKAWQLIDTMNRHFSAPLVVTQAGGHERGGAQLTELGRQVLAHYRALERKLSPSVSAEAQALIDLLGRPADASPLDST